MCGIRFSCLIYNERQNHENEKNENKQQIQDSRSPSSHSGDSAKKLADTKVASELRNRGPDFCTTYSVNLTNSCIGTMTGCVLHLRGNLTPQPVTDETNNALLWNGEIFDGIQVEEDENDTQVLFNALTKCTGDDTVLKLLESIHGPWAFIYWQADVKKLWFGRDMFGRRSLLWHLPSLKDNQFILSSVATENQDFAEIPSVGIFVLDFTQPEVCPSLTLYPWCNCRWPGTSTKLIDTPGSELLRQLYPINSTNLSTKLDIKETLSSWIPSINKNLDIENFASESVLNVDQFLNQTELLHHILTSDSELNMLSDALIDVLQTAVKKRVTTLPRNYHVTTPQNVQTSDANIAILFSGGLDSTLLAALADRCTPPDESIDLLNVAFEQRPTFGKNKLKEKKQVKKKTRFPKDHSSSSAARPEIGLERIENGFDHLKDISQGSNKSDFEEISLGKSPDESSDVLNSSDIQKSHDTIITPSSHHDNVPYKNISFDPYDVPDRVTGITALGELNPNRKWNFIEINVTQEEVQKMRQSRISSLIYPLQTVLDDSIGCAVWFASQGVGVLANNRSHKIKSKAKVILCGMAADEQFAGYSRHRVTFNTKGWQGLLNEIEEEMWRISSRNLGRDDRIISDHGKESRFPFLDETFTQFVSTIPIYKRADLRLPRGLGEKLLLRLCAYKLGLFKTAVQPKRAIQFGSKIAKMDNRKEKGSDTCDRLNYN
ncbi:asparagine synthetase domain-containing protein 1-like isoform X1 [Biomphalaria glabrata]|uniref:Asparagine synthetase domain-containing protein 1-like isoform X1 n=2 Tax=Biomphalaria glabrata TaxID=6526 RepID=A0A9W3AHN0_BIOGL|nr:asparagine synthetase domain-containing protein 1-like isoform X1 [Biomphalaria glabrata]KAI8786989.1 asparagine synthetase domain-containing protein 1 [Biomphalaria glabrata]